MKESSPLPQVDVVFKAKTFENENFIHRCCCCRLSFCLITYSTIKLTCEIKYKTFPLSLPADDCSQELSNDSGDEFMSRIKSASSTHCLLRPRSMRGIDRSPSGATNQTFNFDMNSTETSMGRSKIVSFNLHLYHSRVFNFTCPNFFPIFPCSHPPVGNKSSKVTHAQ